MRLLDTYLRSRQRRNARRRAYYSGRGAPRRRGGTRVHVTGCCLPVPCGTLVLIAGTGAEIARRRTR